MKIMEADVRLLRNVQDWQFRESRKTEPGGSARARGDLNSEREPVIRGQETSQEGGESQASGGEPQMDLQEFLGRSGSSLSCG